MSADDERRVDELLRDFQIACEDAYANGRSEESMAPTAKHRAYLRNDLRARLLAGAGDADRLSWFESRAGAQITHRSVAGVQTSRGVPEDADAEWYEVSASGVVGCGETLRAAVDDAMRKLGE